MTGLTFGLSGLVWKSKCNDQKKRQNPTHVSRFSMKLRLLLCHLFNFKTEVQNKKRTPILEVPDT